ncbi:TetR/AcrR family transcriptional regulator [Paenibacillus sepulcri]|uniref:TetR/AcrR family transcriptional regulator n=1 Tax=Paenibacillus sepulcri TaxID=359917 RepID=A0ABS7C5U1_9BACL|nr:TetR/AcrR family transcriptional regulator [Paenibacillus sepulcri]
MIVTKHEIISSASRLFSERGFPSTSIQDIADDCQIAKGSVYKYFPSKEDLFNDVFDQCQQVFFEQVEELKLVYGHSPKELMLRQTIFQLQYFMKHKFVLVDFKELPIQQNAKFVPLRLRVRVRLLNWHKERMLNTYGQLIESHIWDLVTLYKAILKEYLNWIIQSGIPISVEETASLIIDRLDALVEHIVLAQPKPVLKETMIVKYMNRGMDGQIEDKEQMIAKICEDISLLINELPSGNAYRQELQEILVLFRAEIGKQNPNAPLIQALLAYLEKEYELKSLVIQLRNVLLFEK